MDLLRDLWRVSPRKTLAAAALVLLTSTGGVLAAALGGQVLVERSRTLFLVLAAALTTAVAAELALRLLAAGLSSEWAQAMRRRLTRVAFSQEMPRLEATPVGELLDRIDDDTHQVGTAMREVGTRFLLGLSNAALGIVAAAFVWWPAGVAFAVVAGLFVLLVRSQAGAVTTARVREEEKWSDLAAVMEEAVHGQDDIRTSLAQPYVLQAYAREGAEVLERGRRAWGLSARLATHCVLLMRTLLIGVGVGGALLVTEGHLGLDRVASVWLLATAFGLNVEHLSRQFPDVQEAIGSWTRIGILLRSPQEDLDGDDVTPGEIRIEHLTFTYGDTVALDDVTLTFRPGRSYALVGRSGSGKSTLAKILARAVPVPAGSVRLGGTDLVEISPERLRRAVATVTQRTDIYTGTVRENVALFDPELEGRVEGAFEALDLTDWVADLPAGLETVIGEGGERLSAGEEQLVAFARVLVRSPDVVILDEATARMDPVTEARVERAARRLVEGRIGIVIAHRLSTVERCDEVVVLSGGNVLEAGPLAQSERFAEMVTLAGEGAEQVTDVPMSRIRHKVEPPQLPETPPARPLWNILQLVLHEKRYGLAMMAFFTVNTLFGLDGAVLGYLWGRIVAEDGGGPLLLGALVGALVVAVPGNYLALRYFPEWWVKQILRLRTRVLVGQTGPRRRGAHAPGEVVALTNDTDRVIFLADNVMDFGLALALIGVTSLLAGSPVPGLLFGFGLLVSALVAYSVRATLERRAEETISARNRFASTLTSTLNGATTVKLAGAVEPVLGRLDQLDGTRSRCTTREARTKTWATSAPTLVGGLLPIVAWGMYLEGLLSTSGVLIAVGALESLRWFGWVAANLVASLPGGRVWMEKAVSMAGTTRVSDTVEGIDFDTGTAPGPLPVQRTPLERLTLQGFTAVHEDGTVGVRDVDLEVERGELVLVTGLVGSGKSSLLRAVAGIVHHDGELQWNGAPVDAPEVFLRPAQVSYVAQLPRVVSGTFSENVSLGHPFDVRVALEAAQLAPDVAHAGGLGTKVGHKGTRLSGGQLQRLALARALAPETELLVADDVSSALDVTTELAVWEALRARGVTVLGSTFKRAALRLADKVVVLEDGEARAVGRWDELEDEWGHLAG